LARNSESPYKQKICSECGHDRWDCKEAPLTKIVICLNCGNKEKLSPGDVCATEWAKKGDKDDKDDKD
jgi:hypothetical protein